MWIIALWSLVNEDGHAYCCSVLFKKFSRINLYSVSKSVFEEVVAVEVVAVEVVAVEVVAEEVVAVWGSLSTV